VAGPPSGLIDKFERTYRKSPNVFRAPGRVNLIGEHTDYNLGLVLPMAIDLACYAASAPNRLGMLRVHSVNLDNYREWPVAQLREFSPQHDWSDYVVGIARELDLNRGYDLMLETTVPLGAGLSSSAALEVSTALALGWQGELPSLELAQLCQRSDHRFLGIPSGIMDQYVSIFGRRGSAVMLDCRSLQNELVQLPAELAVIAVDSRVQHSFAQSGLAQSPYETRVKECAEAAAAMGVNSLREASLQELDRIGDERLRRRARHVITENLRVQAFMAASKREDFFALGQLLLASHRSLRDDYEVSCPTIDFLVSAAMKIEGVWGARITGGGFGGCTVNLLQPSAVDNFLAVLFQEYRDCYNLEAQFHIVTPSQGAEQIY
jgi:galactokinase